MDDNRNLPEKPPENPEVRPAPQPALQPSLGGACHLDDGSEGDDHERPAEREPSDFFDMKSVADEERQAPIELNLEPSEETQEQARALKDDSAWPDSNSGRFSLILAPGRPKNIPAIVGLLAKTLNLSPKGAYYSLLHRHGILTDNVIWDEAEKMAGAYGKLGHPVLLAALTPRIEFGEGLDIIALQEQGEHVQFQTVADAIHAAWSQIVFLAAGQVTITPGTPPRRVMDLFMIQPRHHLRWWDNAFDYTRESPKFRPMAERIAQKSFRAIHTRSLDNWLHNDNEPLHHFASMIEYNHYLKWHLLAHLAPTKSI